MPGRRERGFTAADLDLRVVETFTGDRATVQVKYVDVGDLAVTWRWEHAPAEPRAVVIARTDVQPALDALAQACPSPLAGENVAAALARAWAGPFGDRGREIDLSAALAGALIPFPLAAELNVLVLCGIRPHLRIQPSPSLAQVPWEALRVDEGERLVHNADASMLPPASVRNAARRKVSPADPDGRVVAVVDPVVPGGGRGLGPVLGPVTADSAIGAALLDLGDRLIDHADAGPTPLSRVRIDRDRVESLLAGAARFLYVGHVTTADHGLDVRLHLSCEASTTGRAALVGGHRPLTAADIAFGHVDDRPWRVPNRVALIACNSGGDSGFAEPSGLVAVMVARGAEHVTAARWTLPTDAGLTTIAGVDVTPFSDAVVAVNAAHEAPDPVVAMAAWQRERADAWESTGDAAASPIVWAALTTSYAPQHWA